MDKRLHEHAADLKTLALELGLSQSTVSRALRAHPGIPESTRRRVVAAAEAAGYRPNARARSLATGRTETIGLSFPLERLQLPETNFVDVLAGISTAVTSRNYNLLLSPFEGDEAAVLRKLASSKAIDGVIITRPLVADPRIALLNELRLPFVLHGRSEIELPYSFVDTDNDNAFERLTNLLLDYGHRRIVVINGLAQFRYVAARAASFRRAFAARGLTPPPDAIEFVSMTEATGYETAMRRLKRADCASIPPAISSCRRCAHRRRMPARRAASGTSPRSAQAISPLSPASAGFCDGIAFMRNAPWKNEGTRGRTSVCCAGRRGSRHHGCAAPAFR